MDRGRPQGGVGDDQSTSYSYGTTNHPSTNVWSTPHTMTPPLPTGPFPVNFTPTMYGPSFNTGPPHPVPIFSASYSAANSLQPPPMMSSSTSGARYQYGATPTPNPFNQHYPFNPYQYPGYVATHPFPSQPHPPMWTGGHMTPMSLLSQPVAMTTSYSNVHYSGMQPMTSVVTPSQPVAMTTSSRYQTNSGMDHQSPWQHATPHLQQDRSSMERQLVVACGSGDDSLVLSLINSGVNVNCLVKIGKGEWSPLMGACERGHASTVKLLLQHGAQIDLQKNDGWTALMAASSNGHVEVAQLLLDRGAQIDLQKNDGWTALMVASSNGHVEVAQLLLDHGAQVDLEDDDGYTAMNYAETHEMVDLLMSAMIPKLTAMLQPVAAKWRELGSHLGLNETTLNQCHSSATEKDGCLQAVMNTWSQQNDPHPSWRALIRAVKTLDGDLAQEMDQLVGPRLRTHDKEDTNGEEDSDEDINEEEDSDEDINEEEDSDEDINEEEDNDEDTSKEEESKKERDDESSRAEVEAHHLAAVEKAIREKGELEHTVAHGAFVGPAGSGKSSLMKRLANEEPSSTSPSTGVAERVVQVEVMKRSSSIAISAYSAIWKKILYSDEAIRVIYRVPSSQPPTVTEKPHPLPATTTATTMNDIPIAKSTPAAPVPNASNSRGTPNIPSTSASLHTHKATQTPLGYLAPLAVFRQALQESQLKELRQHFENSSTLYLTDTGGQMEFQEVLPLLVSGPSIFFITFRLDQDLHQRFTIEYRLPDGDKSDPYQSTLTVEEAILQTLASVASMGTFTYSSSQTRSSPLKPKVLIVGTHKDLLDPTTAESKIKEIDEYLQKIIRSTAHYRKDLMVFSSESQLIFTVNNFSKDDSDFDKIRSRVDAAVHHDKFKISYPAHWLIFSLVLRQEMMKDRIISYDQCFTIAQDCGISTEEELNDALRFLHTKIGLVRHFPTPGLDDIVIRDPQVLFDHVTHLIVKTFTFDKVNERPCDEFKHRGIFSFEDLETISQYITPDKLLKLLKELRIVVPFETEDGVKYFIPCVLTHSEECASQPPSQHSSATPPLLITFKCGYCPKGLAGALIVYLLSNEMESDFEWDLQEERIYRDQISFYVSVDDIITIKIHPTYLELVHVREDNSSPDPTVQTVCTNVWQCVKKGLGIVLSDMNIETPFKFSFYCPHSKCDSVPHPATGIDCPSTVVTEDGRCRLWCKRAGGKTLKSSPPTGCSRWFEPVKDTDGCHDNPDATPSSKKRGPSTSPNFIPDPKRRHSDGIRSATSDTDGCHDKPPATPSSRKKDRPMSPTSIPDPKRQHSDRITESDWMEVVDYLEEMDRKQIKRLGGWLGLKQATLEHMKDFPDDMVRAWLRKQDDVEKNCGEVLSWKILAEKLMKMRQTGIANKIIREKVADKIRDKADESGFGTSSGLPATSHS